MKKKIFSLMAALLILVSLTSMTLYEDSIPNEACLDGAADAMNDMLDLGYSTAEAGCVANWYYAECTGHLVTVSDYESCLN